MISQSVFAAASLQGSAAAELVKTAGGYRAAIRLRCHDAQANGKSLLGVIALDIRAGMEVRVVADGDDEEAALEAVAGLIETKQTG